MYIWDQHEFVKGCQNWYRDADLQPGNLEDGIWHEAHYPVPKCLGGTETVLLLKEHHAVQGVLQSIEYNKCCMYGWEKKYLTGHWEYLLSAFVHLCTLRAKENFGDVHEAKDEMGRSIRGLESAERLNAIKNEEGQSVNAVKGGFKSMDLSKGVHGRTPEQMTLDGKRGGTISKEQKLGIFSEGQQKAGGNAVCKQRWQCTVTGKISAAGPLTGYQKARGIDPSNRIRRWDLE